MKIKIDTYWFGDGKRNLFDADSGNDRVWGYDADDDLTGGAGNDEIIGGGGDDILTGDGTDKGTFIDVFLFGRRSGRDVITDFEVKKDMIGIEEGINGFDRPADILDEAVQKGRDVVIDLGDGNTITIEQVNLEHFKDSPADHFYLF